MTHKNSPSLAIVGIGCRYPGGISSADTFWDVISKGTDAIVDVPSNRWDYRKFFDANDKRPGKSRVKQGGYLHQSLDQFDPLFFGISPREAAYTDPQQRLLLEVTWEAFEDAGITEERLRGSDTGVFIGAFNLDNLLLQLGRDNVETISASTAASVTMTMLSNRLSYTFDLTGPSVTMDTACSSSMVAMHYACQSIINGDCSIAIAGGVNVISRPEYMVSMSKGGFLSAHGRCKSFDKDAAGYVRGEGAGIIIIKTLEQAIADKDEIYAVIRNTGVNQDGHTQNGISFPSAEAQQRLIEKLYREAAINPLDVGYIEAHGTGTQAGDPIEISSLSAVFTPGRPVETPCFVGSVKSNFGHTESAAGVAGIIKASLSIKNGAILPNLHFNNPNPNIDFAGGRIAVPTSQRIWNEGERTRLASVNSFGYGGTNGHVILEEFKSPISAQPTLDQAGHYLLPLSAKNRKALNARCSKLLDYLQSPQGQNVSLNDLNYSLAYRQSGLEERLSLVVKNKTDLEEKLRSLVQGDHPEGSVQAAVDVSGNRRLAFVFTGMGPQWWAMGRELYAREPVFQQVIDQCDELFSKVAGWSIKAELLAPEADSKMAKTAIAQPANFLIQAGLLALYRSWGVTPAAVVGHSVGEVASVYACGALTLEDAITVSYQRSRLQQTLAGGGGMLAIGMGGDAAFELTSLYDQVSVAAVNSATSVTLAGNQEQLEEISQLLEAQGIFNRMLQVEVAYHSYQMDPIKDEIHRVLADIHPHPESIPVYSTALGSRSSGSAFTADYWWQNVRQPVSFERAITQMIEDGYTHFIEVGPHPVTRNFLNECLADKQIQGRVIASLVRKKDESVAFLESLGQLFNAGYHLRWPEAIQQANFIRLPTYPWQRERYWNESNLSRNYLLGSGEEHPFFFEKLMTPEPTWQVELNENYFPFLPDHRISGRVVFPGAGYVEAGLALQHYQKERRGAVSLEQLKFHRMLMVDADKTQQLRIVEDKSQNRFAVYSSEVNNNNWTLHATGKLVGAVLRRTPAKIDLDQLKKKCATALNIPTLYRSFDERGLGYGAQFQTIEQLFTGKRALLARISAPLMAEDAHSKSYLSYPSLLDGAFQSLIALSDSQQTAPMVPVEVGEVTVYQNIPSHFWCYGEILEQTATGILCDLKLLDDQGNTLAELRSLECTLLAGETDEAAVNTLDGAFYHYQWTPRQLALSDREVTGSDAWLILASEQTLPSIKPFVAHLEGRGISPKLLTTSNVPDDEKAITAFKQALEENLAAGANHLIYFAGDLEGEQQLPEFTDVINPCLPLIALAQSLNNPALATLKAWIKEPEFQLNLNIVTRGAHTIGGKPTNPALQPAASLAHLLANELSAITPRHIDLALGSAAVTDAELQMLVNELLDGQEEDIALQGEMRFIRELTTTNIDAGEQRVVHQIPANDPLNPVQLRKSAEGSLEFQRIAPATLRPDDVQVQIERLLIDKPDIDALLQGRRKTHQPPRLALGWIVATGADCDEFALGDEVLVLVNESAITNQYTLNHRLCLKRPAGLPENLYPDLAFYAAALYMLDDVAGGTSGKVFIQNAASPLGLALGQLALARKLTVFATISQEAQRQPLQAMGVHRILNNKDLTYTTDLVDLLGESRLDLVVNDLGNEHATQLFKLLAPGKHFIQLPAVDGQELAATPALTNYRYAYLDIFQSFTSQPGLFAQWIERAKETAISDSLPPLPKGVANACNTTELLNYFVLSDETGQAVIEFTDASVTVSETLAVPSIDRSGSYLITGGTSGLGLQIAKWLLAQGVDSIALVSRNGSNRPEAREFVQSAQGKQVRLFDVDITDLKPTQSLVQNINKEMRPLAGIIHCAMVLDDDLAVRMTPERMKRVMQPKVQGTINLHKATLDLSLRQFICISSISSLIGNVGQANYVAANAFLDGFAHYRQAAGLPATTINLGVLQEIGVVARDENLAMVLDAKGIQGLLTADVLRALGYIMNNEPAQIGLFNVDWAVWAQQSPKSAASSRFSSLVQKARARQDIPPALAALLSELEHQEQYFARLLEILSGELAQIVKVPLSEIKQDRSISDLGIDSIMSVELSRGLRSKYGLEVTSMELLSGPSLDQLTEQLVNQLTEKTC
ncbi:type I polyketide synthase [Cellvibrio fibrivorans]|uniref:Acyl transferase domain-containing protein/NADPH:quinone reductase-like Zn-dependent oxidoreductase/acyl carrier protein n=1 Tax=Cellvibrio fibrivorans TaxID=126350 RepID=A0ABU1V0K5_9GAMM|nr:SDR family NAD(P)-dependent oxidoreductase [Cellvibrio fibrivorans]MDR7090940.1 acyl transferase domain-containing protein/NADPH:quinone reductase-like Zn-dependent oxidoreductase/acyl carrier protein [Cellvibrio fibrivorans]